MKPSNFKRIHSLAEKALQFNFAVGSGKIYPQGLSISKSANCPEEDKPLAFQTWYTRHGTTGVPIPSDVVTASDATVLVDEYSRKDGVRIRARKGEGDNNFVFEHFRGPHLQAKKIVKGKHGAICSGDQFSAKPLSFHTTLPRVVYLAEAIAPTADLFTSKYDPKNLAGNEYRHNYGENLTDVYYLGIYVYDYEKQKVFKLKGLPEDVSITSVAYFPGSEEKLLVTFLDDKHKLLPGLSMCMNKESKIYVLSDLEFEDLTPDEAEQEAIKDKKAKDKEAGIKEEPAKITKKLISKYPLVMFPSVSPSGKKITYFYRDTWIDTHLFNTGLVVYDVESGETTEVVSCNEPSNDVRSLYAYYDAHSKFTWTSETEVVFPSFDLGRCVLNFVNIETKTRRHVHLNCHFETDNVSILDITDDLLLLALNNYYYRSRIALVENF